MNIHTSLLGTCALVLALGASAARNAAADQVFASNVEVIGSICSGFDCVDHESFGFDTLKLKENNLRIFFQDTSVASGFPSNSWRLIANDYTSGGAAYFAIEDSTAGRQVFRVSAGAPLNSLFVSNTGNVGLGTSTPALNLHIATGNTPAQRLEQNASNGFSAQTWDIAGNEANFFVRDVTNASHMPFRIRPGAPTSSIDIAASGNVGLGGASPSFKLDVVGTLDIIRAQGTAGAAFFRSTTAGGTGDFSFGADDASGGGNNGFIIYDRKNNAYRLMINNTGNVGIGTITPTAQLTTTGSVRFAGITGCSGGLQTDGAGTVSCLVSSRQFKTITGDLAPKVALANIMALRPQTGSYKETPDVPEHWLIAEDVAAVDPALAGLNDGKPHTVKTQNIVADLVAVAQQQQREIEALKRQIAAK